MRKRSSILQPSLRFQSAVFDVSYRRIIVLNPRYSLIVTGPACFAVTAAMSSGPSEAAGSDVAEEMEGLFSGVI